MRSLMISAATSSLLVFSLSGCGDSRSSSTTTTAPSPRIGSYVVIGDWGHDANAHGGNLPTASCQDLIAQKLNDTMAELGDVKFIINVGDSFYPDGVNGTDDPQWDVKWRDRYHPFARSVPWFSVYGNHDYHHDPGVCSDVVADGAQINGDINDLDTFFMPDYNFYYEWPELELEIIGMDLNNYMDMWKGAPNQDPREVYPASQHYFDDCQWTACNETCVPRIKKRADEAFELFKNRSAATLARNVVAFSHYPTDYFWDTTPDDPSHDFLANLREDSRYHLAFFGGHRHSTDQYSTTAILPNDNWVAGGGGGWSCDTRQQGIVVGEIHADWTMTTRPVYVDPSVCCDPAPARTTTPIPSKETV